MMDKISPVRMRCKKLVSFDVKSLFTNVPIDEALRATSRAVDGMTDEQLPLPRDDYMELIGLCVRFGPFEFMGQEYEQLQGLAMGSPLSAVMAQLFMEALEADHLCHLAGRNATWYRYVDDILAILPGRTDVQDLLERLNAVHPTIKFTVEEEREDKLPFLDTVIHRRSDNPLFCI